MKFSIHWHDWEIVASNIRVQPILTGGIQLESNREIGTPYTDILYKCACGKIKEDSIHGRWTLEQLRAGAASEGESNGV